ncbi:MAG: Fic family protein [Gammaproteobacteria bacterium]|jgi:Fic family protein
MNSHSIEPMLPSSSLGALEEQALKLTSIANRISVSLPSDALLGVGELVRSMNCYYSNLIEGHPTLPREIDDALKLRYSDEPERRDLQLEAVAHIEVQRMIDLGEDPNGDPTSSSYIRWVHYEFCKRLPEELLVSKHPKTGVEVRVIPGEFRNTEVIVGRHVPPEHSDLHRLLEHFEQSYSSAKLRGMSTLFAIPAAHHRLLWIHPFVDGNGRVARLISHTMLNRAGLGSPLWSVSRGLARNIERYKATLAAADQPRQGDLDGRGSLSLKALLEFCQFFFESCIDQVTFMEKLLDPSELGRRIKLYARDEIDAGRLSKGSTEILLEAFTFGHVDRGKIQELTGYKDRRARQILVELVQKDLLVSTGPRKPVRLGFPLEVIERWLPTLYV